MTDRLVFVICIGTLLAVGWYIQALMMFGLLVLFFGRTPKVMTCPEKFKPENRISKYYKNGRIDEHGVEYED